MPASSSPGAARSLVRRGCDYVGRHRTLSALTLLFFSVSLVRFWRKIGDFEVYYAAALRLLNGASIHMLETNIFTYPTAAAVFMAPLPALGYTAAKTSFFLCSFALMMAGIAIVNRALMHPQTRRGTIGKLTFVLALACTLRFVLAVFNNQQTDLMIFGLIAIGLHAYRTRAGLTVGCWSAAAMLKANPLFMILMPGFQHRWRICAGFMVAVVALMLLPDTLKYLTGPPEAAAIALPATVLPRDGAITEKQFALSAIDTAPLAYVREYLDITFAATGPSWWQDAANPLNQSLTRVTLYYWPGAVNGNLVFLGWCAAFALALFVLVRRAGADGEFIIGLLCYAAFVLIGPVSSKPHFVAFYGLFIYCWHHVLARRSLSGGIFLAAAGLLMGFTSSGFLGEHASRLAQGGQIGLAGTAVWVYAWWLAMRGGRRRDSVPAQGHPRESVQ